jgi:CBS domain-containing protein
MQAKDVMTPLVVAAAPDMPASEIARLMSKHGISGLPVVDSSGTLLGIVSEGDLIGRMDVDRERRRDWWLTLFSETPLLSADSVLALAKLFAKLRIRDKRASEIMSAPVVTIGETTDVQEIADLLTAHRIKRVPVVRDGKVAGIVSRADLGPVGAMVIGVAAGVLCYAAVTWLKALCGYDDALDCFGVHASGGAAGAILTGVFAIKEYGGTPGYIEGNAYQVLNQLIGVVIVPT